MPRMGGYVPSDHKTRHQDGGRDEISIASLAGNPANRGAASGLASLNSSSKVVEQPASISDFLEASPTDGLATKAPDSNWAYDHKENFGLHVKVIRKTADETVNNSDTLQNDDELLFALAANEVWAYIFLPIIDSGPTPDIKVAATVPSGATHRGMSIEVNSSAVIVYSLNGIAATVDLRGLGAGSPAMPGYFAGIVINGATAGNFQIQWAQNTADASNTKMLANSCLIMFKLA